MQPINSDNSVIVACIIIANALVLISLLSLYLESSTTWGSCLTAPLLAFIATAFLSSFEVLPTKHIFYEFGWASVLPSTLVLTLIKSYSWKEKDLNFPLTSGKSYGTAYGIAEPASELPAPLFDENKGSLYSQLTSRGGPLIIDPATSYSCKQREALFPVGVAFLLGSAGTVLGSIVAYFFATNDFCRNFYFLKCITFAPSDAAKCSAIMTATYTGGSINLLSVAKAVRIDNALLGCLGGADVVFLGLYSAALIACRKIKIFDKRFPPRSVSVPSAALLNADAGASIPYDDMNPALPGSTMVSQYENISSDFRSKCPKIYNTVLNSTICLTLTVCLLCLSMWVEKLFLWFMEVIANRKLNGSVTQCLSAVIITLVCNVVLWILKKSVNRSFQGCTKSNMNFGNEQQLSKCIQALDFSGFLASLGLVFFFAVAGCSAAWADVVAIGPAAFAFSAIIIVVHFITLVISVFCWNLVIPKKFRVSLDELIIASNANIGGPSTAAALAGGALKQRYLVTPGIVFGILGFAIGDPLAMAVYTFLR